MQLFHEFGKPRRNAVGDLGQHRFPTCGFNDLAHPVEEGCGIGTINGAVIEALGQNADGPDRDGLSIFRLDHHRFLRHSVGRQDGDLRLVDYGSGDHGAEHSGI